MLYQFAADMLLLLHLAFIVFAAGGGLLVLRWPRLMWFHLPAVTWAAAIEFFGWFCPLTPLENRFRSAAGGDVYSGGFIEHYILPVIYPAALTRPLQIALGCALVAVNLIVYYVVWMRWRSRVQQ